jgi:surfeit locus 1 family protein
MIQKMVSRKWILVTVLVILGAALCVRLGIWQLDRLAQRRASNAHYAEMVSAPAVNLPTDAGLDLSTMEYRAINASGNYDFSRQIVLFNQYFRGQIGYHILTPLVLSNGTAVLVDRGWIPAESKTPESWSHYDEPNPASVQGIIRLSRAKADFTGQTDPALASGETRRDIWIFPNIARIQQQMNYKLLPIYIQKNMGQSGDTPPVPDQPVVDISEGPHFGYALQWFTFALILLLGYPYFIKRQEKLAIKGREI